MFKILLIGVLGYIGSYFKNKLKKDYEVIVIFRNIYNKMDEENVMWKLVDLFDLDEIIKVMKDVDIVIYLVYFMMLLVKLMQVSFEDMDVLLVDNFVCVV